jgi:hypothetical protein
MPPVARSCARAIMLISKLTAQAWYDGRTDSYSGRDEGE